MTRNSEPEAAVVNSLGHPLGARHINVYTFEMFPCILVMCRASFRGILGSLPNSAACQGTS